MDIKFSKNFGVEIPQHLKNQLQLSNVAKFCPRFTKVAGKSGGIWLIVAEQQEQKKGACGVAIAPFERQSTDSLTAN